MRKALLTSVFAGATLALMVPYSASAQQGWGGQQQPGQWGGQQQFGQQQAGQQQPGQWRSQQQFGQQPGQQQFGQRGFGQQQFGQRGMQFGQRGQLQGEGTPLHASPSEVLQVEQRLSQMGFDPGDIDGRWNDKTERALENFQKQAGLSPTGNLNLTTLSALGVQLGQDGQFLGIGQQQQGMQQRGQQPGMQWQQGGTGQGQAGGGQQNGARAEEKENGDDD